MLAPERRVLGPQDQALRVVRNVSTTPFPVPTPARPWDPPGRDGVQAPQAAPAPGCLSVSWGLRLAQGRALSPAFDASDAIFTLKNRHRCFSTSSAPRRSGPSLL